MLYVKNLTRNTVLVEHGRVANDVWTRFRGLIGVRYLAPGDGLAIIPCQGVHCMFMSIPIDVLYVDKHDRVVGMDQELKPWRFGSFYKGVRYVIELPAGTIARTTTEVGDQLEVTY
ncbi:MAG: DUF192 domain-containing protein [Anaerolineae bacterium]